MPPPLAGNARPTFLKAYTDSKWPSAQGQEQLPEVQTWGGFPEFGLGRDVSPPLRVLGLILLAIILINIVQGEIKGATIFFSNSSFLVQGRVT